MLRILLVEDSATNIIIAQGILKKAGHHVDVALNGIEAISLFQASENNQPYDIILMDLMMPEMDGIEATQKIRQRSIYGAKIPIVAMTANATDSDKKRYHEMGMNAYIAKPFDTKKLLQLLPEIATKNGPGEKQSISITPSNTTTAENTVMNTKAYPLLEDKILAKLAEDTSPELLPEMLKIFINELDIRQKTIQKALKQKNLSLVAAQAHTLKSSSGTYGALCLQATAKTIESYSNANDMQQTLALSPLLFQQIEDTISLYKKQL